MNNMDNEIIKKYDFRKVIISNIEKCLNFTDELFKESLDVVVDVNSILSILFRYDRINDDDLAKDISYIFETFIDKCIESGTKVTFLYTGTKSLVHTTIYPNWCKERYDRVSLRDSDFVLNLIMALKKIKNSTSLIDIINIGDKHVAHYIYENHLDDRPFYLVSKDFVNQGLIYYKKCIVYTGINYIDFRDPTPYLYDYIDIKSIAPEGYEYMYPLIRGDVRNEYKGMPNYGTIKTSKFLRDNKIKIIIDSDYPMKDLITKYKPLYSIEDMTNKYYEIKNNSTIDKDKKKE